MKNRVQAYGLALILGIVGLLIAATPPAPPSNPTNPLLPPAGMFVITNTTLVYTNVAVKTPTISFQNVTIYGGTNAIKGSTCISWTASPDSGVNGYRLYYGPVSTSTTNTFETEARVTTVLFYNVLSTNTTYWAYVTAFSTNGLESVPSNAVLVHQ